MLDLGTLAGQYFVHMFLDYERPRVRNNALIFDAQARNSESTNYGVDFLNEAFVPDLDPPDGKTFVFLN